MQYSALVIHPGPASRLRCSPGPGFAQPLVHYRVGTPASPVLHLAVHPRRWNSVDPRRTYGAAWVRVHSQAFAQHLSCATTPAVHGWDTVAPRLTGCTAWGGPSSSLYTVIRCTCALSWFATRCTLCCFGLASPHRRTTVCSRLPLRRRYDLSGSRNAVRNAPSRGCINSGYDVPGPGVHKYGLHLAATSHGPGGQKCGPHLPQH